ncbi:arrestin domain-containing protein 3-like [Chaetodon auriga]|uniref:arrestin domain-containing protein 3-like n=1 Tax=Chaetodon auriga TaxID=39042 RepID=UPI00403288A7
MPSIQSFTLSCDALNDDRSVSEGDTLTGRVTLALLKDSTIESFFVKATGDAQVSWRKKSGDRTYTYSAHKRYFKLKHFFIPEESGDTVIPRGTHVYDFSLQIPQGSMPSTFRGPHGRIFYKLQVKLTRGWKANRTIDKEIHFVSKSFPNRNSLMSPQIGSTDKEMGFFSKGKVHMDVTVDRTGYAPGDTIVIVAKIDNSSSTEMTPKFSLIRDIQYRAQGHTKNEDYVIQKVVGNCIKPKTQREVKCEIKIPHDQIHTIHNCDILAVQCFLKVYLDISFAFDPEVMFPVFLCPPELFPGAHLGVAAGPYPGGAAWGPSNTDFPYAAGAMSPYPAGAFGGPSQRNFPSAHGYSEPPPAYPEGYKNPVPQQPFQYGDPFTAPSSVLHPPPSAPAFHATPSAPDIHPSPFSHISPTPPTYNQLPSAPPMNTDFLSQSDEAPPAYSLLFPSSDTENTVERL